MRENEDNTNIDESTTPSTPRWRDAKSRLHEASRMIRRRIPRSGHLMTAKKFWLQTLPSKDCDVVIIFPAETPESTILYLRTRLNQIPDLSVNTRTVTLTKYTSQPETCLAFQITTSYSQFLQGLEDLKIPKPLREDLGGGLKEFSFSELNNYKQINDEDKFISSSERQAVLNHLINSIRAEKGEKLDKLMFREGEAIIPKCLNKGVISQVYPLHELNQLKHLQKHWVQTLFGLQPLDKIREYFGLKISLYFGWLGHYTTALIVPATVGIFFWVFFHGGTELLEDLSFVLFSFFNLTWATLYLVSWKRRSAELSHSWGTIDQPNDLLQEPSPLYHGEERISEVTGKPEPSYPAWKRYCFRYFVTVPVISISLAVVFLSVFLMLEFQEWMDKLIGDHGLVSLLRYIPKIVLAIVIPILDVVYNWVAVWLNTKENYRTMDQYENHLIYKLVLFQFVNSFLALFYTAFYLQDIEKLKELLAALLITRQVLGNLKESILPYASKQFRLAKMSFDLFGALSPTSPEQKTIGDHKKTDGDSQNNQDNEMPFNGDSSNQDRHGARLVSQVEIEAAAPQYEGTFDDYLEMFIQFGYVTLFSSAYPLAAFFALINNIIEIRSDAFKLCFIHQRPFPQRVSNIGSWHTAMEVMGVIGIMVNCGLIGILGPVHRIFPDITPQQQVILIVVLEHVMLLLKLLLTASLPDTPYWIVQQKAKTEFKRREVEKILSVRGSSLSCEDDGENGNIYSDSLDQEELDVLHSSDSLQQHHYDVGYNYSQQNILSTNPETDEFLATINNLTDVNPFNRPQTRSKLNNLSISPVNEASSVKSLDPEQPDGQELRYLNIDGSYQSEENSHYTRYLEEQNKRARYHSEENTQPRYSNTSINPNRYTKKQASESDILSSVRGEEIPTSSSYTTAIFYSHESSSPVLSESPETRRRLYHAGSTTSVLTENSEIGGERVVVNKVNTPPMVDSISGKSTPTPPGKRILNQKEFDKKLKAKQTVFSKSRSLSLASFKLPSRLRLDRLTSDRSNKISTKTKTTFVEEKPVPRGELEMLDIEQLINVDDLSTNKRFM